MFDTKIQKKNVFVKGRQNLVCEAKNFRKKLQFPLGFRDQGVKRNLHDYGNLVLLCEKSTITLFCFVLRGARMTKKNKNKISKLLYWGEKKMKKLILHFKYFSQ